MLRIRRRFQTEGGVHISVVDDIWALIFFKGTEMTAFQIAELFNRERKWVFHTYKTKQYNLNADFVNGLQALGYELKLVKKEPPQQR